MKSVRPAHVTEAMRPAMLCVLGIVLWVSRVSAQALPEDVLPDSELDDPIGVDRDSRTLDQAAAARTPAPTKPKPQVRVPPRTGEILTAVPAASEQRHFVRVELEPGLARIETAIELVSKASAPAEALYKLALPHASVVTGLEVCGPSACRGAVLEPSALAERAYDASVLSDAEPARASRNRPLPIARASLSKDGRALLIHAAPLWNQHPLTLRARIEAEAPLHGSRVRLALPARGMDARAAVTEVEVLAADLLEVRAGFAPATGIIRSEPWVEVPISALVASGEKQRAHVSSARCASEKPCTRAVAWAAGGPRAPRDLVLALDVSPSTEGPARGRLLSAITALLETAPPGSSVRAIAFAASARVLAATAVEPALLPLAPLSDAIRGADAAELGAATRIESVLTAFDELPRSKQKRAKPLLVVLGDGGLTEGPGKPFERARRLGLEIAIVNVGDRPAHAALREGAFATGGIVIDAGSEAEEAARGREHAPLHERLSALYAPTRAQVSLRTPRGRVALGPLRAGESISAVTQGAAQVLVGARSARSQQARAKDWLTDGHALLAVDARARSLGARLDSPPACVAAGQRTNGSPDHGALALALAEVRSCPKPGAVAPPTEAAGLGKGMPKDPLLDMLRLRILPMARGCFRSDRKGRAKYDKRAVFAFTLADREVVDARVEGAISDSLRACLLDAVDSLEVPRFTGLVRVRYPLVTESVPEPQQIELTAGTARDVDALVDAPIETRGAGQKP